MKFRKLHVRCECGRSPTHIRDVGLSAEHELVIRWSCTGCKRQIYVVKSLSDCWHDCPTESDEQEASETNSVSTSDLQFLHSLGVKFPEVADS
jgi:hypothetical protein